MSVQPKGGMAAVRQGVQMLVVFLCMSIVLNKVHAQEIIITEICASNDTGLMDPNFGRNADWIELFNPSNHDVNLGSFYLTDDPGIPLKWKFPGHQVLRAGDYLVVFADDKNTGLHTNFKLSKEGEYIGLYKSYNEVIDSFTFRKQITDISYGRNPAEPLTFEFYTIPSPGTMNHEKGYKNVLGEPVFTRNGGFYTGPVTIDLNQTPGEVVYFTTDGTVPTWESQKWDKPLTIHENAVIRARAIGSGCIPSEIVTSSFFVMENIHQLPVFSISTDPGHLFSDSSGIYVVGTNGKTGYCDHLRKRNYCQKWERPAHIEYFDEQRNRQFTANAGIKIHGNCSRNAPQKSLALFARKKYGDGKFNYSFFSGKPHIKEFEALILRNAGNDNKRSLIRDGLTAKLVKNQMDIDWQAYQPVVVYINGMYWGIMNLREKLNEHYIASNHDIDPGRIDYLEVDGNIRNGSDQHYLEFLDGMKKEGLDPEQAYEYAKNHMDMEEYINYLITQIYVGNTDWPRTNWRHWRPKTINGKWRWVLYDTDFGFNLNENGHAHHTLAHAMEINGSNPHYPSGAFIFNRLMESESFREAFVHAFLEHLETTFSPERVIETINNLAKAIEQEMPAHTDRWGMDISLWQSEIDKMKAFARKRPVYLYRHLDPYVSASTPNVFTEK